MSEIFLNYSTYLVSKSSILTGIGAIFDFVGSYQEYNTSNTVEEADTKAAFLDWLAVGDDLKHSLTVFEEENNLKYESA